MRHGQVCGVSCSPTSGPGSDPDDAVQAVQETYRGPIDIARPGLVIDLA